MYLVLNISCYIKSLSFIYVYLTKDLDYIIVCHWVKTGN